MKHKGIICGILAAVIMATFFREKVTATTVTSILLALVGIGLLYKGNAGISLSTMGILLVMISSLTYAVYIVIVNQSSIRMSTLKLTFYILLASDVRETGSQKRFSVSDATRRDGKL